MLLIKHLAAHPKRYAAFFLSHRHGTCTLREFENWVARMIGPNGIKFKDDKARQKFKGDAFEVLAEIFFLAHQNDPKVGLTGYTPVGIDEDYGVDATGTNANGVKAAIQVKYRGNPHAPATFPTYAEIARTFASGVCQFSIDPFKDHTVYVFTNADQVGSNCAKVLGKRIVSVHRDIIQHFIDNNRHFWRMAAWELVAYYQFHGKNKVIKEVHK